jgi:flagellar hook-length control protein FliK
MIGNVMNTTHTANLANIVTASTVDNKKSTPVNDKSPNHESSFKNDMKKASDDKVQDSHQKEKTTQDTAQTKNKHALDEDKNTVRQDTAKTSDQPLDDTQVTTALMANSSMIVAEESTNLIVEVPTESSIFTSLSPTAQVKANVTDNGSQAESDVLGESLFSNDTALGLSEISNIPVLADKSAVHVSSVAPTVTNLVASVTMAARKTTAAIPPTLSPTPLSSALSLLPTSTGLLAENKSNLLGDAPFVQQLTDTLGADDPAMTLLAPRAKAGGGEVALSNINVPSTPTPLNTHFQSPRWGEAVTEKVMWMSSRGLKEATIQLDPPELGQMKIKIGVHQDQAQVSFTVQNTSVREALDSHALRLREMFAEEGLNLADVDVSDQSQSQADDEQDSVSFAHRENDESDEASSEHIDENTQTIHSSYSLIDSYV